MWNYFIRLLKQSRMIINYNIVVNNLQKLLDARKDLNLFSFEQKNDSENS